LTVDLKSAREISKNQKGMISKLELQEHATRELMGTNEENHQALLEMLEELLQPIERLAGDLGGIKDQLTSMYHQCSSP
jgi:hypothetical protein